MEQFIYSGQPVEISNPNPVIGVCKIHGEIEKQNTVDIEIYSNKTIHCGICYAEWIKSNITELT